MILNIKGTMYDKNRNQRRKNGALFLGVDYICFYGAVSICGVNFYELSIF